MNICVSPALWRYGRRCSFENSAGETVKEMNAFINPLRYKNKMYLYGVNTRIGYNTEGYYLYIGPADTDITADDCGGSIVCGSDKYRIDRAEKVCVGDSTVYYWAVIRKTTEAEDEE